ncbi:MAG: hypothetical protein KDI51_15150 [Xanthomonadales bacterium]|nr:hypothetical protein [Xanthomonadales bacterium]
MPEQPKLILWKQHDRIFDGQYDVWATITGDIAEVDSNASTGRRCQDIGLQAVRQWRCPSRYG